MEFLFLFKPKNPNEVWEICWECGVDMDHFGVLDEIWEESELPKEAVVCLTCFSKHLKRPLKSNELTYYNAGM